MERLISVLKKDEAVVGYFNRFGKTSSCFSVREAAAVTVGRDPERPWNGTIWLTFMPFISHDNHIEIGGGGWRKSSGKPVKYFKVSTEAVNPEGRPVGWLCKLNNTGGRSLAADPVLNTRLKEFAEALLDFRENVASGLPDRQIDAPELYYRIKKGRVTVRREAAKKMAIDLIRRGSWAIQPNASVWLSSPSRGTAVRRGDSVEFQGIDGSTDVFHKSEVEAGLERAIQRIFGSPFGVKLVNALPEGRKLAVAAQQPFFAPTPRLPQFSESDFNRQPEQVQEALRYIAALTTVDDLKATDVISSTAAYVDGEDPLVDLTNTPHSVIINKSVALRDVREHVRVDMYDVPPRVEWRRRRRLAELRAVAQCDKQEQPQRTQPQ